jgi:hypothetical protein
MIRQFWVSKTEKLFKITQIGGTFLLVLSGSALKANPDDFKDWGFL